MQNRAKSNEFALVNNLVHIPLWCCIFPRGSLVKSKTQFLWSQYRNI